MSNWGNLFSYISAKELAKYVTTYNMDTQTIAVDGTNVYNIQSTGTGQAVLDGDYINSLTVDAELLITGTEVTDQWAGNTAYAVDDEVVVGTPNGNMYKCLIAHTSENPPGGDANWQLIPNLAGYELEHKQDRFAPPPSEAGLLKARACVDPVAQKFGIKKINRKR